MRIKMYLISWQYIPPENLKLTSVAAKFECIKLYMHVIMHATDSLIFNQNQDEQF